MQPTAVTRTSLTSAIIGNVTMQRNFIVQRIRVGGGVSAFRGSGVSFSVHAYFIVI